MFEERDYNGVYYHNDNDLDNDHFAGLNVWSKHSQPWPGTVNSTLSDIVQVELSQVSNFKQFKMCAHWEPFFWPSKLIYVYKCVF